MNGTCQIQNWNHVRFIQYSPGNPLTVVSMAYSEPPEG